MDCATNLRCRSGAKRPIPHAVLLTSRCPTCTLHPTPQRLADVVNDEGFRSLEGKSKHQLWLELCDLVTKHPNEVKVRWRWLLVVRTWAGWLAGRGS